MQQRSYPIMKQKLLSAREVKSKAEIVNLNDKRIKSGTVYLVLEDEDISLAQTKRYTYVCSTKSAAISQALKIFEERGLECVQEGDTFYSEDNFELLVTIEKTEVIE